LIFLPLYYLNILSISLCMSTFCIFLNDGLPMKNGKRMPKRKYMGDSASLRKIQKVDIHKEIDKIFK